TLCANALALSGRAFRAQGALLRERQKRLWERPPIRANLYAIYTGQRIFATPLLCADSYSTHRCINGAGALDIIYLLLAIVLIAATIGFLLICDRLGRR
ncbi:MAG TPA: hypothetical protein VNE18_04585, partial [Rhodanobacter sp.]|nr:hypothetical protein [Rhodanobacter sp.]